MENSIQETNAASKSNAMNGRANERAASASGVIDQTAAAAHSAASKVNSVIDHAAASGHQAVNRIDGKVEPAQRWASEKSEALFAIPKNAVADARQYVVTHPWQSLGVAVLAGVLLGRKSRH